MSRDSDYYMIKIDDIEDGFPKGNIINPCFAEIIRFYNLGDLVLKINQILKHLDNETKHSSTKELPCFHSFRDFVFTESPKYFFVVQMIHSDDISWHGVVEGSCGHKRGFKSTLDLMCRIDNVIKNGKKSEQYWTKKVEG